MIWRATRSWGVSVNIPGLYLGFLLCVALAEAQTNTFPSSGNVGIGTTSPTSALTLNSGAANYNPSLIYGSAAAWALQSSGVELAAGVDSSIPYAYWLQARQISNQPWAMSFNPAGGNVGIGTANPGRPLDVSETIRTTATGSDAGGVIFPDGSQQTTAWTGVLCGGDYAESVDVTGDRTKYEPGDVLVVDPDHDDKFLKSAEPYSHFVAGIYSTRPGAVGRHQITAKSEDELPMAMIGIVPTKVTTQNGSIHRGDLLVTSFLVGYAMKGTDHSRLTGAVIGKALDSLPSGTGIIEVLVTLQ